MLQYMQWPLRLLGAIAGFSALLASAVASDQVAAGGLTIRSIAEVEQVGEHAFTRLVPADRVVPGDRVMYTLEVRNAGATAINAPTVTNPIPLHMQYVEDSAVGPGAEVSYSVDGGVSFDAAANLKVQAPDGTPRAATAADYTHIRWQLRNTLKAHSIAFVRFRAVVK